MTIYKKKYILSSEGTNLVTNGGMELLTGWSAYNTPLVFVRSADGSRAGSYSLKIVSDSANDGAESDDPGMTAGETYAIKNSVYGDGTNSFSFSVELDGPTYESSPVGDYIFPASWTDEYWSISIPAGNTASSIIFKALGSTGTAYLDEVGIYATTNSLDGIDGDDLEDGDLCHVFKDGVLRKYVLDADSGETALYPNIVAPVLNPGDKRWKILNLIPVNTSSFTNPPSAAELGAEFQNASEKFTRFIDNGGTGDYFYIVVYDGTNWWQVALTKAT